MKRKIYLLAALMTAMALVHPVVTSAIEIEGLSVHGFVSQGYLKSDKNNYLAETKEGTFEYNETALNFSLRPIDNLRLGVQVMSRDMGPTRNNDIYLDWGFGDYRFAEILGVRIGKIKYPMGFYNQTRDVDFLRTFILLPQGFYSEIERGQVESVEGCSIYGDLDIGLLGDMEYEIAGGTANADVNSPNFISFASKVDQGLGGAAQPTGSYQNVKWQVSPFLRWNTPLEGLGFGFGFSWTEVNMGRNYIIDSEMKTINSEMAIHAPTLSVEYTWDNLRLAAEYRRIDGDADTRFDGTIVNETDVKREAYYGAVSYQFLDWLELGTYYSVFYPDRDDKDGSNLAAGTPDYFAWQKDWTVTAKFTINENIALKLETHFIDGAAQIYEHENPDEIEGDMILYAAKCSFNF